MKKTILLSIAALMCGAAVAASQPVQPKVALPTAGDSVAERFLPEVKAMGMPELEKTYWMCEGETKTGMLDLGDGASCSIVYEELKLRKFKGDFNAFMTWWKVEKVKHK